MQLSDDERDRIRAEETYRDEVRRILAENKAQTSFKQKLLAFLNTSLGLWLLSAICLSGIGGLYGRYRQHQAEVIEIGRLDREIAYRFSTILLDLNNMRRLVEEAPSQMGGVAETKDEFARLRVVEEEPRMRDALARLTQQGSRVTYLHPEYATFTIPTLVSELRRKIDDEEEQKLLDELLAQLALESAFLPTTGKPSEVHKRIEFIQRDLILPRWRNSRFPLVDCRLKNPYC